MSRHIKRRIKGIAGFLPVAAADLQGVAAHSVAGAPDFSIAGVIGIADSQDARVCKDRPKVKAVCGGGFFIKEYRHHGFWRVFRYAFKESRPFRALRAAERLRDCGVATPAVLLALEGRRRGCFSHDYLVTEELPEDTVFANRSGISPAELLDGILPVLVAMHDGGVAHGDLNLRNIYQRSEAISGYGEGYRWGVVDLDGCSWFPRGVPDRIRSREIARFATSVAGCSLGIRGGTTPELLDFCELCAKCYLEKGGVNLNRLLYRRHIKIFAGHYNRKSANASHR